jgi:hypothetical protein
MSVRLSRGEFVAGAAAAVAGLTGVSLPAGAAALEFFWMST